MGKRKGELLKRFDGLPNFIILYIKDGLRYYACHYCSKEISEKLITKDHIIPRSKGGYGPDNIVPCCRKCNLKKADMSYYEYMEKIKKSP